MQNWKNLEHVAIAEIVGVSAETVSRWKNQRQIPRLQLLIAIADRHGYDRKRFLLMVLSWAGWI